MIERESSNAFVLMPMKTFNRSEVSLIKMDTLALKFFFFFPEKNNPTWSNYTIIIVFFN